MTEHLVDLILWQARLQKHVSECMRFHTSNYHLSGQDRGTYGGWKLGFPLFATPGSQAHLALVNLLPLLKASPSLRTREEAGVELGAENLRLANAQKYLFIWVQNEGVPMVRSELVRKIADAHPHLSSMEVEAAVETILNEIVDSLASGSRVEFRGFGSFASKDRDARIGRNPKTGAPVPVAAKQIPRFRASKQLQERLNGER